MNDFLNRLRRPSWISLQLNHYLSRGAYTLADAEVDNKPRDDQGDSQVPLDLTHLVNAARNVQHFISVCDTHFSIFSYTAS